MSSSTTVTPPLREPRCNCGRVLNCSTSGYVEIQRHDRSEHQITTWCNECLNVITAHMNDWWYTQPPTTPIAPS